MKILHVKPACTSTVARSRSPTCWKGSPRAATKIRWYAHLARRSASTSRTSLQYGYSKSPAAATPTSASCCVCGACGACGALDLLVHPAWMEGLGVSLLQASAASVPSIACRVGGIPEAVRGGVNGVLVEAGEVETLAQALTTLLADPAERRRLGRGGRELIERELSVDARVEGNPAVYRQLFYRSRGVRREICCVMHARDYGSMEATMKNRSVVITGGAQGIGKAICQCLVESGLHVVLLDVDELAGRETAAELGGAPKLRFVPGSAGDPEAVGRAVQIAAALGDGLQGVVANAGISRFKPFAELELAEWESILRVNLTGAFLLAKAAAPYLAAHEGSAMVLMASSRALMSEPGTEAYSASKGGIVALTHALAMSLGPKIRVNCVSPGWIATEAWQRSDRRKVPALSAEDHAQHPVGRVGRPQDIASMVRYLLSPEAGFITGQNFIVDGGMTRKMIYV